MEHKLIFVEGLPGTGKTTISEYIFGVLIEKGVQTELLLEGNEKSPSNFCDISGVPKNVNIGIPVHKCLTIETENYIYVNIKNSDESATQLRKYDIGDEFNKLVSVQEYVQCTLEWWQYWVNENVKDSILVLDSAFLQCPINEMILRGASDAEVVAYIKSIAKIIHPHNPICIYLRRESAKEAIDFAKSVKGKAWAEGIDRLVDIGCPDLFERRFILENTLLSEITSIICTVTGFDWSDAEARLKRMV